MLTQDIETREPDMTSPSIYTLSSLTAFGVDPRNLGCVMLDLKPVARIEGVIPPEWGHTSGTNSRSYSTDGVQTEFHTTLKFGLVKNANLIRPAIDEVLSGWEPPKVIRTAAFSYFSSPNPVDPYSVIVAHLASDPVVWEANRRLSMLPHVDTFPFRPHVTLAYVDVDHSIDSVRAYRSRIGHHGLSMAEWEVTGINYGRILDDEP